MKRVALILVLSFCIFGIAGAKEWRDPVTGMQFVWVPGGSFLMGCHVNAGECDDNEKLARTVRVDGFWMGKHEVTQGQWKRILGNNPSNFKNGDNYPVEKVSWNDVQKFIRKLNAKSSATFRLSSEAEWEYACRSGGKPVKYAWGNDGVGIGGTKANFADKNSNYKWFTKSVDDGFQNTAPVGSFAPNVLGLYDMSGNVFEWVQDKFAYYSDVGTNNPIYEGFGGHRIARGGSWAFESRALRCSFRLGDDPTRRSDHLGFRLMRES